MGSVQVHHPRWVAALGRDVELIVDAIDVDRVAALVNTGYRVTAVVSLTCGNAGELRHMAAAAIVAGARKVRISPRGAATVDLVYAAVEVRGIAEEHAVEVQFDVTSRTALLAGPAAFLHLDPLVVEQDGTVVPMCWGMDRRYALGNLHHTSLATMRAEWDPEPFLNLCRATWWHLAEHSEGPLVPWYEHLVRRAADQRQFSR